MNDWEMSEVQLANFNQLLLAATFAQRDLARACGAYGITVQQAHALASLTMAQSATLVAHLGDECLFLPRTDLLQILATPTTLTGVMSLARPPQLARPAHAGPRVDPYFQGT